MKKEGRINVSTRFLALILAIAFICLSFVSCKDADTKSDIWVPGSDGLLEVHFIDVGQADCELIVTPSGDTILIDAGLSDSGDDIVDYITLLGITEIDLFVATHYHADHIGGSHDVFLAFDVLSVLTLDCEASTATARKFKNDVVSEGCEVIYAERGYEFSYGEVDFLTLSPHEITDKGANNDSIMLRMEYKETRYIFTGDAEKRIEFEVIDYYGVDELSADVLKVGHHGSRTSSTEAFLKAVSPSIAVISCGKGNSYGHPHTEVYNRLTKLVENVYRTDINGDVVVVSDGKSAYIENN